MPNDAHTASAHIETLSRLNQDYIRSVATSDVRRFEELLSDDFLNSNADGSLVDRAAFLNQIGKPSTVPDLQCEDVRIRLMDDMAIVHGRTTYTKADGQAGAGRYTDIWVLQGGRWRCVAAHVTRG
jgi:ketosteroid isomerase-like protein